MNIHVAIDIHRPSGGSEQWTFLKIQSEDFIMPSIEMMAGLLFIDKTTGWNRIFFSIWSKVLHFWSGVRNNRYHIVDKQVVVIIRYETALYEASDIVTTAWWKII